MSVRQAAMFAALSFVAATGSGCCTFKSWFGGLTYEVGVAADADANSNGPTRLFLLWVPPERAAEADTLKNIKEAKDKAETWRQLGEAESADLGEFAVGIRRPNTNELLAGQHPFIFQRLCLASNLIVFTNMADEESPDLEKRLKRTVSLSDASRPYTKHIAIHIQQRGLEVKFLPDEQALYFHQAHDRAD